MNNDERITSADPLASLGLPPAIRSQASKLLRTIGCARTSLHVQRAADRAEGFALGLETVHAIDPSEVEKLYLVFFDAYQVREADLLEMGTAE